MTSLDSALRRPASRRRKLFDSSGFEDSPPLTLQAVEGEHPRGRELSLAWLTGTVMTGLTSVLLMGSALYVSFEGQDNFSTPSDALEVTRSVDARRSTSSDKGDRLRPLARTRSDIEVLQASIQAVEGGRTIIRSQQFTRVDSTLALSVTQLAEDIPVFDPLALAAAVEDAGSTPAPQLYSASVEGEVAIRTEILAPSFVPASAIGDRAAADFVRASLQDAFFESSIAPATAYAVVGIAMPGSRDALGFAENVTSVPMTPRELSGGGRTERILTVREAAPLEDVLRKNGISADVARMLGRTLANVLPTGTMPADSKLRILMGPSRSSPIPVPYRLSIYFHDRATDEIRHAATAAMTDRGGYVVAQAPSAIQFPEDDTEAADIKALPSIYRSIWETTRRHELDDDTATQITAMFAYEVDLTQRVTPGDGLKLLTTTLPTGETELLYAALTTGTTTRELFRFQGPDGAVDYYSPDGASGKRFLLRRPVEGSGRLSSRYGYRIHPIFKTRRLHSGVDLAAPRGTPIYAGGDGEVDIAGWTGGYGQYVAIDHVNGFRTTYAHMNRIAPGLKPGSRVRQGQLIGYVGSTGNSTGNHLHYEILINGRTVDPLSVKLPRDKELPAQSQAAFAQITAEIRQLMERNPSRSAAL
jgi:murein DD-endopeptidase MepM/ murein hydrolase activator NlpD